VTDESNDLARRALDVTARHRAVRDSMSAKAAWVQALGAATDGATGTRPAEVDAQLAASSARGLRTTLRPRRTS
jgi:hypothetical protein